MVFFIRATTRSVFFVVRVLDYNWKGTSNEKYGIELRQKAFREALSRILELTLIRIVVVPRSIVRCFEQRQREMKIVFWNGETLD